MMYNLSEKVQSELASKTIINFNVMVNKDHF
jgi:hypothetical protein